MGKVKLRREVLRDLKVNEPFTVFDACHGHGKVWSILKKEFRCRVFGTDLQRRPGALKIDAQRVIRAGVQADIYDFDTYGYPWKLYLPILPHLTRSTTIFLTLGGARGKGMASGFNFSRDLKSVLGLPRYVPPSIGVAIARFSIDSLITKSYDYFMAPQVWELEGHRANARYLAVHLIKENPNERRNVDRVDGPHI